MTLDEAKTIEHWMKLTQEAFLKIDKLESEIKKNEKELLMLQALEECGVDNWEGYGEAKKLWREWIGQ